MNLASRLQSILPADRLTLLRRVADSATEMGFPLYIVGGFVRDLVLGRGSMDFDLVVEGDAIKLARALVSRYGGKITIHDKFKTAKWFLKDAIFDNRNSNLEHRMSNIGFLDLISSRNETYSHPAALPTVTMGSIADDIRRRDFTINTLAIRLGGSHFGELRDDLGGLQDLENRIVRVLHPRSFMDDPTRMFRAVRYEQRYGFKIAKETLALIPGARGLIDKLSAQRIRHELDLILAEPGAASMLRRLDELDLLKPIHPALHWDKPTYKRIVTLSKAKGFIGSKLQDASVARRPQSDTTFELSNLEYLHLPWLLWLMPLSEKQIESLNKRLHFTAALLHALKESSQLFSSLSSYSQLKSSQCVQRLDKIPPLSIYAVSLAAPEGKPKQALQKYLAEWRHVKPKTTGHDLKKLGIPPGPKYQKILWSLRAAWLDGEIKSKEQEAQLLQDL